MPSLLTFIWCGAISGYSEEEFLGFFFCVCVCDACFSFCCFIIYFAYCLLLFSLCSLGNPPASASRVLGLQVYAVTPGFSFFYNAHEGNFYSRCCVCKGQQLLIPDVACAKASNFCFRMLCVQGPAMFLEVVLIMVSYRE